MDELINLICWVLGVFGAANGIAVSALMQPFRDWVGKKSNFFYKLVTCVMCLGFWLGFLASFVWSPMGYHISTLELTVSNYFRLLTTLIFNGFIGSASSWLLYLLVKNRQFGA